MLMQGKDVTVSVEDKWRLIQRKTKVERDPLEKLRSLSTSTSFIHPNMKIFHTDHNNPPSSTFQIEDFPKNDDVFLVLDSDHVSVEESYQQQPLSLPSLDCDHQLDHVSVGELYQLQLSAPPTPILQLSVPCKELVCESVPSGEQDHESRNGEGKLDPEMKPERKNEMEMELEMGRLEEVQQLRCGHEHVTGGEPEQTKCSPTKEGEPSGRDHVQGEEREGLSESLTEPELPTEEFSGQEATEKQTNVHETEQDFFSETLSSESGILCEVKFLPRVENSRGDEELPQSGKSRELEKMPEMGNPLEQESLSKIGNPNEQKKPSEMGNLCEHESIAKTGNACEEQLTEIKKLCEGKKFPKMGIEEPPREVLACERLPDFGKACESEEIPQIGKSRGSEEFCEIGKSRESEEIPEISHEDKRSLVFVKSRGEKLSECEIFEKSCSLEQKSYEGVKNPKIGPENKKLEEAESIVTCGKENPKIEILESDPHEKNENNIKDAILKYLCLHHPDIIARAITKVNVDQELATAWFMQNLLTK
eukprot:TRINITY_DN7148_c0_g2_i1.p1 TRINITY_DN7148_c0_g2~~TRINITY_DN7148_c0_g2_i1.p1  ORF type:complete len:567 (-),score=144.13 TRINITY_DN7148_c0_g2_i1:173-1777(-)